MAEREQFNRRTFLTGAAATAAATAGYLEYARRFPYVSPVPERNNVSFRELALPPDLVGLHVNYPFLWKLVDNPPFLQSALANVEKIGAESVRVIINYKSEPGLGVYDFRVLKKIKRLASLVPLQVDLFDGFDFRSDYFNPVYGRAMPRSPYLASPDGKSRAEMLRVFFTDPRLRGHFVNRIQTIVDYFKDEPNITAWSVANELSPPPGIPQKRGRELLNGLYEQAIWAIREVDKQRTIVSGVADPTILDERRLKAAGLDANTIHLYGNPLPKYEQYLPLFGQEIGSPRRLFGVTVSDDLYDTLLSYSLSGILPYFTGLVLWRLSFAGDPHRDGFEIIPENLPRTTDLLHQWRDHLAS